MTRETTKCPAGYARDKDGNCVPNVPKANCCDWGIYIPSEANMLPVTALLKSKNEVGRLDADIFYDIITGDLINKDDKARMRATSGVAMGVLNPNIDTGHNTGFGMFTGVRDFSKGGGGIAPVRTMSDSPAKNNLYVVGCARSANFWSAFVKGILCSVNTDRFNFDGLSPEAYIQSAISEQSSDSTDGRDGMGDKPKYQRLKNWLFESAGAKVLYVRTEDANADAFYSMLTQNVASRNTKKLFVSSEVPAPGPADGEKGIAKNNLFTEYSTWLRQNDEGATKIKEDVISDYKKTGYPVKNNIDVTYQNFKVRDFENYINKDKLVKGSFCTIESVFAFLEDYKDAVNADIPIIIVLDTATLKGVTASEIFFSGTDISIGCCKCGVFWCRWGCIG